MRPERRCRAPVAVAVADHAGGDAPPYLEVRPERLTATLTREPQRQEVPALRDIPLAVRADAVFRPSVLEHLLATARPVRLRDRAGVRDPLPAA